MSRGPDGTPVAFHDLPAAAFPVTITGFVGEEQIWEVSVQPYVAVEIPAAREEHLGKVRLRLRFATGEEIWQEPMSADEASTRIERRIRESGG
jgi:hypothetical protein